MRWDHLIECVSWPRRALYEFLFITPRVRGKYGSVLLVHRVLSDKSNAFVSRAREALALIENNDPTAWSMVQREIRYLINTYHDSGGSYRRQSRICVVDFDRSYRNNTAEELWDVDREWYVASLAGTIVHEATHGRIYTMGVPYNEATRVRIERLCRQRERRFMARLQSDIYNLMELAPPFEASDWEPAWNPVLRRERSRRLWVRVQREVRAHWKRK